MCSYSYISSKLLLPSALLLALIIVPRREISSIRLSLWGPLFACSMAAKVQNSAHRFLKSSSGIIVVVSYRYDVRLGQDTGTGRQVQWCARVGQSKSQDTGCRRDRNPFQQRDRFELLSELTFAGRDQCLERLTSKRWRSIVCFSRGCKYWER